MLKKVEVKIPTVLPGFVEKATDSFVSINNATVADWKAMAAMKDGSRQETSNRRKARKMVEIARSLRLPDDVVLLPHLEKISEQSGKNVVFFPTN
jgi:hypothetical protein